MSIPGGLCILTELRKTDLTGICRGKYALTTTYYWMYFSWRINAEAGNWEVSRYVLFIVFASANSVYSFAWGEPLSPPYALRQS